VLGNVKEQHLIAEELLKEARMDLDMERMTILQLKERAKDVETSARRKGRDSF